MDKNSSLQPDQIILIAESADKLMRAHLGVQVHLETKQDDSPQNGISISEKDSKIIFQWLGVELSAKHRIITLPEKNLAIEYPFKFIDGETETLICSVFMNEDGGFYSDAGCTAKLEGKLSPTGSAAHRIAQALLKSDVMKPLKIVSSSTEAPAHRAAT